MAVRSLLYAGRKSMFRESVKRIAMGLCCLLDFPTPKPSNKEFLGTY